MERDIIDAYFMFMWNAGLKQEFHNIFDGGDTSNPYSLGSHILNQYKELRKEYTGISAPAVFWSEIDRNCQKRIVERAIEWYKRQ